jgi:hypothetical protein
MTTATISHAIFGGWTGVTDADVPAIGWSIIPDREDWAYLADPGAGRPATEQESAAYQFRYAYPDWKPVTDLVADGTEFAKNPPAAPAPSPVHVTPVPPVSQPVTASGEIVPATGPIPDATRERLAAEAAQADAAQKAADESLSRWGGKPEPEATQVIPAAGQITEAIEAVTEGEQS